MKKYYSIFLSFLALTSFIFLTSSGELLHNHIHDHVKHAHESHCQEDDHEGHNSENDCGFCQFLQTPITSASAFQALIVDLVYQRQAHKIDLHVIFNLQYNLPILRAPPVFV